MFVNIAGIAAVFFIGTLKIEATMRLRRLIVAAISNLFSWFFKKLFNKLGLIAKYKAQAIEQAQASGGSPGIDEEIPIGSYKWFKSIPGNLMERFKAFVLSFDKEPSQTNAGVTDTNTADNRILARLLSTLTRASTPALATALALARREDTGRKAPDEAREEAPPAPGCGVS